jgi:hypothetical protein
VGSDLGVEELDRFLVDFHVFSEGDRRRLSPGDEMAPAPWLTCGVKFFDNGLMVLERMHLGEVIMAGDLGQARDKGVRVVAEVDVLLGEIHRDFDFWHRAQLAQIRHF